MSYQPLISFSGTTRFKIMQGETYVVPDIISAPSPTNKSSGVYPEDTFDGKREVSHALLYGAFSDAAGPTDALMPSIPLRPNDSVVLSAVTSNVVTVSVNGTIVFSITGVTTSAGVLGALG